METDTKPRLAPGIAARKIGDETVLVSPETGKVFVLNETGGLIWRLCDGTHSLDELAEPLVEEFDIPLEQARSDVEELLQALAERQLVELT